MIRKTLIMGLSALVLGSCTLGVAKCNTFANYTKTKIFLEIDRPNCKKIEKKLKKYKEKEDNFILKYLKYVSGDPGVKKAYKSYLERYCE